jgi:glycosyltransferase involved in cell wall biosynthesis
MAPDVVFIPTARWLECEGLPVTVMVRNMEPLLRPFGGNQLPEAAKNLARSYVAWRSARKAHRVIAVSEHVRHFLLRRWNLAANKVGMVYHGIEQAPPVTDTVKPEGVQNGAFVFTAGSIRPARGLEDLILAIAKLSRNGFPYSLVIGGQTSRDSLFYHKRMKKLITDLGIERLVVWAGQMNSREMSWCYRQCSTFVVTSRAEACPNTVLEAMSHGCLSISTDDDPMPEFFGDSAYYYRARDSNDLACKLSRALQTSRVDQEPRRRRAEELSRK